MGRYIVRRIFQAAITIAIITTILFVIVRLSSDPMAQYTNNKNITAEDRARIAHNLGLDQPLYVQYLTWLGKALQGDFGESITTHQPVMTMISERLLKTLVLMSCATALTIVSGLGLGVYSAVHQYSLADNVITAISFIGYSMPVFFIGFMLIYIFAVGFKNAGLPYLPTGADVWDQNSPVEWVRHLILPVVTLAAISIAGYTRYLRSSMLEVLHQDFIRTARAKGLSDRIVLWKHALKNAALPFITVVGLDLPALFAGALVTETIFSWPGMGRLFWNQAEAGDFPVMMAILLISSVLVVTFQILVDVVYTFLDPRIKLA